MFLKYVIETDINCCVYIYITFAVRSIFCEVAICSRNVNAHLMFEATEE